jgi:hypothetical protein
LAGIHPDRTYAAGPASVSASSPTTNDDVLLPLLPKGLVSAMNADPNRISSFEIKSIIAKIIGILVE